jgi:hypothetical protein
MSSMYTATQVTALYSASISACFRLRACFSASPSRFSNFVGSGRGSSGSDESSEEQIQETEKTDSVEWL